MLTQKYLVADIHERMGMWWKLNDYGYSFDVRRARRFTREEIDEKLGEDLVGWYSEPNLGEIEKWTDERKVIVEDTPENIKRFEKICRATWDAYDVLKARY